MSLVVKVDAAWPGFRLRIDFAAEHGMTGVFGRSGAGKTSLLDVVAGIRKPLQAFVKLNGYVLTDTAGGIFVPVRRRRIGYVSQNLSLFPHLSVRRNLLYGSSDGEGGEPFSLAHVTKLLEIAPLIEREITHLSGGELQRVALARVLLSRPRLLLLDEPLANLDAGLKAKIIPFLRGIRDEFGIPTLYVSHDPMEMVALCQNVLVIERGEGWQLRTPEEMFEQRTETVYRLRGDL